MKFFNAKRPIVVIILGGVFIGVGLLVEPHLGPSRGPSHEIRVWLFGGILVIVGVIFIVQGLGTLLIGKRHKS